MRSLKESRRPTIDGEPAVTVKEAAEMIGISRAVWYDWERRGWTPEGVWVRRRRGGGKMKVFTPAQINALKAAIARGEHPGAVGSADAAITRVEAARMLGISVAKWDDLRRRGVAPPGRWVQHPKGFGHGGRRKVYTPDEVQKVREALEGMKDRRLTIGGEQAITATEAAELIGISKPLWYLWKRKGWVPEGTWVDRLGAGGEMEVFTPAQIGALKASIERGEHPGAQDRGGPDHTITRRKAAAMLGITTSMWSQWEQQGIVPRGKKPALSPTLGLGGSRRLWTPAQVEEVRLKAQELGILNPAATPEHILARDEAARMAGISGQMWAYWSARGVIPPGRWAPHEKGSGKGGLRKLYSVEEVRQARAALDAIGFGRTTNATPEHTITLREAARMLGVTAKGWHDWEQRGLVPTGAWGRNEGNTALRKLYTPAQVEEAREALQQKGVRCFARATTEHTISRQEAMKIIGVSATTWNHWERQARTPVGAWGQARRGRCKLYTRREIDDFAEELRKQHQPYPDPDHPGCYRVPIRSWKRRMEAIIDAADLSLVEGKNWNYSERRDDCMTYGVVTLATCTGRQASLKQIITGRRGRRWRIRHANGDFLDCRRDNLVVLEMCEQVQGNRKMRMRAGKELTSKYKGVCWDEERGKWLVQITQGGTYRHVGRFDDEIDAAEAYDEAARELFSEFAHLNFPSTEERRTSRTAA